MTESVVRSAHACDFERKSGEKEWGGEKEEENWLVGPVDGKERKGKNSGIGLRKEISFGGVETEEEEEKKDGRETVKKRRGVEVQVGKESWTRNGTV